jgi:hypothetical protein
LKEVPLYEIFYNFLLFYFCLQSIYSPQYPVIKYPQFTFSINGRDQVLHPYKATGKIIMGPLLQQHGTSLGSGWRDGLQLYRVAANTLNRQLQTVDKGWSSSLEVGHGENTPSPRPRNLP